MTAEPAIREKLSGEEREERVARDADEETADVRVAVAAIRAR
jgi:hypothetical protein